MRKRGLLAIGMSIFLGLIIINAPVRTIYALEPIKIGVLNPFTGPSAEHGLLHKKGIDLFLKQINNNVAGRKIEVYHEDTEGKPEVGLVKAKRLVGQTKVNMLMGVVYTSVGYALRGYVNEAKVPLLISAFVGADDLTHPPVPRYIFRSTYTPPQFCSTFADWAYKVKGYRKAVLFSLDYAGGYEDNGAFARVFKDLGGRILQEIYAPFGTVDYAPYIVKIDKTADCVFGLLTGDHSIKFARQWAEFGFQKKIPLLQDGLDDHLLDEVGPAAEGITMVRYWHPTIDTTENKNFMKAYYDMHGVKPGCVSEGGYTAMRMIVEALKAVKGNIEDTEAFLNALEKVDIPDVPRGRVRFDKYHHAIQNFYVGEVQLMPSMGRKYTYNVVATYKDVDQFWPYTPEQYLSKPKLVDLKGTWAK